MPFFVYILYSPTVDQYYIGHSEKLDERLFRHNNSGSKSTRKANGWKLVYKEAFATKPEAYQKEIAIKKKKSRKYVEWIISSQ